MSGSSIVGALLAIVLFVTLTIIDYACDDFDGRPGQTVYVLRGGRWVEQHERALHD